MKNTKTSKLKIFLIFIISLILLIAAFVLSLFFGTEKLFINDIFTSGTISNVILYKIRLPRSLLVLISGILLSGAGSIFQMFFRNPLAEPGIMGISSGATLGAVAASALGLNSSIAFLSPINLWAFIGAIISGLIVTLLASGKSKKESTTMLLLCGTALGTLYASISSIILLTNQNNLHSLYAWTLGSFNGKGWKELFFILIPAFLSIISMIFVLPALDLLTGGEQSAASLGLNIKRTRIIVLTSGALASSCAVCAGGTISFIGLIAPHIVRKIFGAKSKTLFPFSMIFGATLLLLADTLARTIISPAELPAGIITAILGVPFFISLCLKSNIASH